MVELVYLALLCVDFDGGLFLEAGKYKIEQDKEMKQK